MTPARMEEIRDMLAHIQSANPWHAPILRDTIRELLDYISELQRGGAAGVPELTDADIEARLDSTFGALKGEPENEQAVEWTFKDSRWAYNLAVSRIQPIPADRVLADGMVGVDREELGALREIAGRWCPPFGVPHNMETIALFDRLRSAKKRGG